jgi:hypothetical protein
MDGQEINVKRGSTIAIDSALSFGVHYYQTSQTKVIGVKLVNRPPGDRFDLI